MLKGGANPKLRSRGLEAHAAPRSYIGYLLEFHIANAKLKYFIINKSIFRDF